MNVIVEDVEWIFVVILRELCFGYVCVTINIVYLFGTYVSPLQLY